MNPFLEAHGYDPGPTQKPGLAGALTGMVATLPAIPVLAGFGSLEVQARILSLPVTATIAAGALAMIVAGLGYGCVFRRAANDRRGGWLFGMGYAFFLWAAGAVMVLPLVGGGRAPAGQAAIGIALALIVWGMALGAAFPWIHRRLHIRSEQLLDQADRLVGPDAAVAASHRRRPLD